MAAPDKVRIPYEDFDGGRFQCVGRLADGRQFMAFLTGAFPKGNKYPDPTSDWESIKRWVGVLHTFDAQGNHLATEVRMGGFESEGRDRAEDRACLGLRDLLGGLRDQGAEACDVHVKPFSAEIDGVLYGLFYETYAEDGHEGEYVMLEPNDIMFHPPWDSGEYST